MDWTEDSPHPVLRPPLAGGREIMNTIGDSLDRRSSWIATLSHKLFPLFFIALFLCPLFLFDGPESRYNTLPVAERRKNLKGLEMVTTAYLNAHPEDFNKLIRIVSNADDALQEEESPVQGAVMKWLERSMDEEGFAPDMPVFFLLRTLYLKEWADAYFTLVDAGEREYLFDLMGATIGGLYRCTCAPPGLHKT